MQEHKQAVTVIETKRLILRHWRDGDEDAFAKMCADSRVMEHFPKILTREETLAVVKRITDGIESRGFGFWALEIKRGASFAGFVGLSIPRFGAHFTPCVEIGWRLAFDQWGNGYATEAALACLQFGFETLKLTEIVSFTVPANTRSRRVMEKIGMTHDPKDDFEHPNIETGHSLKRHVLYRIRLNADFSMA